MEIQVLGAHSIESQNTRLTSLLIDEVLALDAGSLATSLSFASQHKLRAILLSHQHFDHVRDIPMIGMSFIYCGSIKVYSIAEVFDALSAYLLNHKLYPNFLEWPLQKPSMEFVALEPGKTEVIEGYEVVAIPQDHTVPAVGYQISSRQGKKVFYTGDTGPELASKWELVSPDLIITEVSGPDQWEKVARQAKHLTPGLLRQELGKFRQLKGYLPSLLVVHINPFFEDEIREELGKIAADLGTKITIGQEGLKLVL